MTAIYIVGDQFKQTFQPGVKAMQVECRSRQKVVLILRLARCPRQRVIRSLDNLL